MRVLLVEDDPVSARTIGLMLKSAQIVADHAATGEEAIDLLRTYDYDIVILDFLLPDMKGADVIREMRRMKNATPVLVLSGLSDQQTKVRSFETGADDYLVKPFDREELLARLRAIVRRAKGFAEPTLRVGPIELRLGAREVLVNGKPIHLTGKEFSILELLMLRRGMVLSKEAFLNHLYGGMDEPEIKIIDVFVCKLRKKLAEATGEQLIGTVWGRGYVLREPQQQANGSSRGASARVEAAAV
ncbi:response regulator transcription factor [Elioraea thermophila]|uniref:response regulator transcription factor n=1 Tax=Elioraea thermophila TaxID=2185104 RepID=UPI000DF12EE2|nr:response regulator transcription factor [Elioraea thermophila]